MFSVLFEVHPRTDQWDTYLGYGKMLRLELEDIDGFVDNIRYRSLTREGWLLSLSGWRDEKALVRWRTSAGHHGVQEKGRDHVLIDYHLRVGQLTRDSRLPEGCELREQRLDETESGEATALTLIDARQPSWDGQVSAQASAEWLGLKLGADGLAGWDVFTTVLEPSDAILLMAGRHRHAAEAFENDASPPIGARLRHIRVVRDYGMFDRHEAPQYYPTPRDDHR